MTKEPLAILFGGKDRLKIIRLFVGNPHTAFDVSAIAHKTEESTKTVKKNLEVLKSISLIVPQKFTTEVQKKVRGKVMVSKIKVAGFVLNKSFEYLNHLSEFLVKTTSIGNAEIEKRLRSAGKIKLILVAGIFIQDPESRVDIFIVGTGLKKKTIERAIKGFEAELGRELRYSAFEATDFKYRLDMYDKLVRDVIDYPHRVVLDKIGIEGK
jgi:hypothetical protein